MSRCDVALIRITILETGPRRARVNESPRPSAGFAGATLSLGEVSEGAVEAPSDRDMLTFVVTV